MKIIKRIIAVLLLITVILVVSYIVYTAERGAI